MGLDIFGLRANKLWNTLLSELKGWESFLLIQQRFTILSKSWGCFFWNSEGEHPLGPYTSQEIKCRCALQIEEELSIFFCWFLDNWRLFLAKNTVLGKTLEFSGFFFQHRGLIFFGSRGVWICDHLKNYKTPKKASKTTV